mmetsp:Transcript_30225/g.79371  ORF Transcript_30225/g.79371 Transcript_30225/m.79371 type:complete len:246 (-) Transcript_30225:242-979(-)
MESTRLVGVLAKSPWLSMAYTGLVCVGGRSRCSTAGRLYPCLRCLHMSATETTTTTRAAIPTPMASPAPPASASSEVPLLPSGGGAAVGLSVGVTDGATVVTMAWVASVVTTVCSCTVVVDSWSGGTVGAMVSGPAVALGGTLVGVAIGTAVGAAVAPVTVVYVVATRKKSPHETPMITGPAPSGAVQLNWVRAAGDVPRMALPAHCAAGQLVAGVFEHGAGRKGPVVFGATQLPACAPCEPMMW